MKRKYFLFRKEDLSLVSSSSSDTGKGLSVFGVSADSMSYITAIKGGVVLYFNNATPYEDNSLTNGESFEKTVVTVNCEEGKEVDLVESIMNFLGSENSPTIMRFDSVDQSSSLKEVKTSVGLGAVVKSHPINRVSKKPSLQLDNAFTPATGNVVNDIDFFDADDRPILDLEGEVATFDTSSPFDITAWVNNGTGGSTYDVDASSCVGTITQATSVSGLSKNAVTFGASTYCVLSNTLTVKEDYTLYLVYASTAGTQGSFYGSANGETSGFTKKDEHLGQQTTTNGLIGVRHQGRTALPAFAPTTDYFFPANASNGYDSSDPKFQECFVFVIRRDSRGNIFAYNHLGDVVAEIDALDVPQNILDLGTTSGDTTGALVIDQIGSSGGDTGSSFKGQLARFGVIEKDLGDERCRNLAEQLFNLYES